MLASGWAYVGQHGGGGGGGSAVQVATFTVTAAMIAALGAVTLGVVNTGLTIPAGSRYLGFVIGEGAGQVALNVHTLKHGAPKVGGRYQPAMRKPF